MQLTRDHGTHEVNLAPDFSAFPRHLFDGHDAAAPGPLQRRRQRRGDVCTKTKSPNSISYHLQPVEFFTVPGADGTPLDAELIKPPGFDPRANIR